MAANLKIKVTEQGVVVPKEFLNGIKEVEIRQEHNRIVIVPIEDDPILGLGSQPISDGVKDASENHDAYIYG